MARALSHLIHRDYAGAFVGSENHQYCCIMLVFSQIRHTSY